MMEDRGLFVLERVVDLASMFFRSALSPVS